MAERAPRETHSSACAPFSPPSAAHSTLERTSAQKGTYVSSTCGSNPKARAGATVRLDQIEKGRTRQKWQGSSFQQTVKPAPHATMPLTPALPLANTRKRNSLSCGKKHTKLTTFVIDTKHSRQAVFFGAKSVGWHAHRHVSSR